MNERDREAEKWRKKGWSLNRLVDMKNSRNALLLPWAASLSEDPTAQVPFSSSSVLTSCTPCRRFVCQVCFLSASVTCIQLFAGACRSEGHSTDVPSPRDLYGALFPPAAPSPSILPCSKFLCIFLALPPSPVPCSSVFPITLIQHSEQKQPGEEKVYSAYISK